MQGRWGPDSGQNPGRGPWLGDAQVAQTSSRPAGLQEVARRFHCRGCYSKVCDLPLDCPGERGRPEGEKGRGHPGADADPPSVQDVTVTRGRQAMFSCTVNFQLPKEEITYSWKFVGGVSPGGAAAKGWGRVLLPRRMRRPDAGCGAWGLARGSGFLQGEGSRLRRQDRGLGWLTA